jgi:hypothetical protein
MEKPVSFFVCGVQKGGTTALFSHFCEHPQLSPPRVKETHFFDDESRDWDAPDCDALHAFFDPNDGDRLRFDITPIYMFWPPALARIAAYRPQAKLIFLLRDPFERAWSHWCMDYVHFAETLPFANAIRDGRKRLEGVPELAPHHRAFNYLERGLYGAQVTRALSHFPREQMLFLRSEDLRDTPAAPLAAIAAFLEIEPFPDKGPKIERVRPEADYPAQPTEADRLLVAQFVKDDLQQFAALTGLNVAHWPTARLCAQA